MDKIVFETKKFILLSAEKPHISREEGGHLFIKAKRRVDSRVDLTNEEAYEVMLLTMLAGESMKKALQSININVQRINYQENGNWAFLNNTEPFFHIHIYGRTPNSKIQTWGEALYFPNPNTDFYTNLIPFTDEDIKLIQDEIYKLLDTKKYLELKNI